ncbi:MAG: hypothetical protein RR504_05190, partial [Christensenellaceae bacterium]
IPFEQEVILPTEWGYQGLHITFRNADGLGAEIQLTTPQHWAVKLESDAIYEKWRNVEDYTKLNKVGRTEYLSDRVKSLQMWNQLNLPDLMSLSTSSSDNTVAENISSQESGERAGLQAPSKYSKTSMVEVSSNRPSSVKQAIGDTPFNQDLSNEISTATSQVESLTQSESLSGESAGTDTHLPSENSNGGEGDKLNMRSPSASTNLERSKSSSPNTIINQKDGSVNSKTATLQGENQSTIQKTIDKSAVFVTPTSADAPPRKNPPIPTESDAPSAVAKTA